MLHTGPPTKNFEKKKNLILIALLVSLHFLGIQKDNKGQEILHKLYYLFYIKKKKQQLLS